MNLKTRAIIFVIIATLFASAAQILYKTGASNLPGLNQSIGSILLKLLTNYHLVGGLCLYAVSAVLLIIALKNGELSLLYPIIALGYVWVSILSVFILGESMGALKWAGVFFIVLGVSFIGYGSSPKKKNSHKKQSKKIKARSKRKK